MAIQNRDPQTGRIVKIQSIEERFWSHVRICEHGRACAVCCWPWTAKIDDGGYGHFSLTAKKDILAHRFAFQSVKGPLLPGFLACHNCPNGDLRCCCNPEHLWAGTNADNLRDAANKGKFSNKQYNDFWKMRFAIGIKNRDESYHPHGENHHNAKLNDQLAKEIFALKGIKSSPKVAKEYGISKPIVLGIWNKTQWKHIHNTP